MTYIQPAGPRFGLDQMQDRLCVAIPARRNWFVVAFVLCWLGGWVFGEISAVKQLVSGKAADASWFLIFWLAAWTFGGIGAASSILWMLTGRELVSATRFPPCLAIQWQVLGIGLRSREFDPSQIRRLRVSSEARPGSGFRYQQDWIANIAFDYGARTYRFGVGLDDAEAQILVDALWKYWPSWKD